MAKRGPKPKKVQKPADGKAAEIYKHTEEKLLLRPDVGLQAQFKRKKTLKRYRYDPGLDPALSWDINADRERGEALIARIEKAKNLPEAKTAAAELRRMSRPFLNWAGKAERPSNRSSASPPYPCSSTSGCPPRPSSSRSGPGSATSRRRCASSRTRS